MTANLEGSEPVPNVPPFYVSGIEVPPRLDASGTKVPPRLDASSTTVPPRPDTSGKGLN